MLGKAFADKESRIGKQTRRSGRGARQKPKASRRRLGFQTLERRELLAVNVQDFVGVVRDGIDPQHQLLTYLLDSNHEQNQEMDFVYGHGRQTVGGNGKPDIALAGAWIGNGNDYPATVREDGQAYAWYLDGGDCDAGDEFRFLFGGPVFNDKPLRGDLNGDGYDDVIVARPNSATNQMDWYVTYAKSDGYDPWPPNDGRSLPTLNVHTSFTFGPANAKPFAGDLDGDGYDEIGYFDSGAHWWTTDPGHKFAYPRNGFQWPLPARTGTERVHWGLGSDTPIVGNWDGLGGDEPGLVRVAGPLLQWFTYGYPGVSYGFPGDQSIAGHWHAPEAAVDGIFSGQSNPIEFGTIQFGQPERSVTFTVRNSGTARLDLQNLQVLSGFRVTEGLTSQIQPGQYDQFTVKLENQSTGTKSGSITFSTNDGNELWFSFPVQGRVVDTLAPLASFSGVDILSGGGSTHEFRVTYTDSQAIDVSDIDNNDVQVTGPHGFSQRGTLVRVDSSSDGSPRLATYRISAPSAWDHTYNGTYTVSMLANQVRDVAGNFVAAGTLGTFRINIATPTRNQTADDIGAVRPGDLNRWYLDLDTDTTHEIDVDFGFGGDQLVTGNWNRAQPDADFPGAVRRHGGGGLWWFLDADGDPDDEFRFFFGLNDHIALVGDFNGDDLDDIAAVGVGTVPDPVVGRRPLVWYISHGPFPERQGDNPGPTVDIDDQFVWGFEGDKPVVGDWDGNGKAEPGVISQVPADSLTRWYIPAPGGRIATLDYGIPTDRHVVGDWDGDGTDNVGVVRGGYADNLLRWYLDTESNFADRDWNPEIEVAFGLQSEGHLPVVGSWRLPEVEIEGVFDGQMTAIDFGSLDYATTTTRSFAVTNTGNASLHLGHVVATAPYQVVEALTTFLAPGESDTFTIELSPQTSGRADGSVSFTTNDLNESPFDFRVTGTMKSPPQIHIDGVSNGQSTVIDFGTAIQGSEGPLRAFTVRNVGESPLELTNVAIPTGFSIVDPLVSTLGAGSSDSFVLQLDTTTAGTMAGQLQISTNDPNQHTFAFHLKATVLNARGTLPSIFASASDVPFAGYSAEYVQLSIEGRDEGNPRDGMPTVMYDSTASYEQRYKMWWFGEYNGEKDQLPEDFAPGDRIYYSYSSDGVIWSKPEVVIKGQGGTGGEITADDHMVGSPSVVKVEGTYYMFYEAYETQVTVVNRFLADSAGGFSPDRDGDYWTTNGIPQSDWHISFSRDNEVGADRYALGFAPLFTKAGAHPVYAGEASYSILSGETRTNRFVTLAPDVCASVNNPGMTCNGLSLDRDTNEPEPIFWLYDNQVDESSTNPNDREPLFVWWDTVKWSTIVTGRPQTDPLGAAVAAEPKRYAPVNLNGSNNILGYVATDLESPDVAGGNLNRIMLATSEDGKTWKRFKGPATGGAVIGPEHDDNTMQFDLAEARKGGKAHDRENELEKWDVARTYGAGYPTTLVRDGYLELYFTDEGQEVPFEYGKLKFRGIRIPADKVTDPVAWASWGAPEMRFPSYADHDLKWSPMLQRYVTPHIRFDSSGNAAPILKWSQPITPDNPHQIPLFPDYNSLDGRLPNTGNANEVHNGGYGALLGNEYGHALDHPGAEPYVDLDIYYGAVTVGDDPVHDSDIHLTKVVAYVANDARDMVGTFEAGRVFLDAGKPGTLGIPVIGDWDGDQIDEVALYRDGTFHFEDDASASAGRDRILGFGNPAGLPVAGDWNGDGKDEVGVFLNGTFELQGRENPVEFGRPGDLPVAGDWDGDGYDEIGVYTPWGTGFAFVLDIGLEGYNFGEELVILFGLPGDLPVAGDWNGDGKDEVGVYRNGAFYFDTGSPGYTDEPPYAFPGRVGVPLIGDFDGNGTVDIGTYSQGIFDLGSSGLRVVDAWLDFGLPGDMVVSGDWDRDGSDRIGVYRAGHFYLDRGEPGYSDEAPISFGRPGDIPMAGDWDGDGFDEVGVYTELPSGFAFVLDRGLEGYNFDEELVIPFGLPGDLPIAGDWNGDGIDEVGVYRNGLFYLDDNGRPGYQSTDSVIAFGLPGDLPVAGDWDGDGKDEVGVFRDGAYYLDVGQPGYQGERPILFGRSGQLPIVGKWATRDVLSHSVDGAWLTATVRPEQPRRESVYWGNQFVDVVAGEWIVKLVPTLAETPLSDAQSAFAVDAVQVQVVSGLGIPGQVLVRIPALGFDAAWRWLAAHPAVESFEPNLALQVAGMPNDPSFSQLWGLHNVGQDGGTPGADIDAVAAWDISTGSDQIVIAVIDTGVDHTHPDLAANMWRNSAEIPGNGIDDDNNGFVDDIHGYDFANGDSDPMDDHLHGTHVAGTIAAVGNNGTGVTGVAWNVKIMALKFLDEEGNGSTEAAVAAINYVTMMKRDFGVNVVLSNNSWGSYTYSRAVRNAIAAAEKEGILFVASAGNDGRAWAVYPAAYPLDNIISVAATDRNDEYAWFSNTGRISVDLAAPGVDIYSTTPSNSYGALSGTSMAAPQVSGVAALLWAASPDATMGQVREALLSGVDPLHDDAGLQTVTNGRLNAHRALERVQSQVYVSGTGVYRNGLFFLDVREPGYQGELPFAFGLPGDRPFAGDWDGDGYDEVGVFRDGWYFLDEGVPGYEGERYWKFGLPGDWPIAGDWEGNDRDSFGVYREGLFYLDTGFRGYSNEQPIQFGLPGDLPVAGDWDGDGIDQVGVFRNGWFFLDMGAPGYEGELPFQFGLPGDMPIAGDWDGDGIDEVGVYRDGWVYLDIDRRGYQGEKPLQFGLPGDLPIGGKWSVFASIQRTLEEARFIPASNPWHNVAEPANVNASPNGVTPLDVLMLINYLNAYPSVLPVQQSSAPLYVDVNNDGLCTPLDVLMVINQIHMRARDGEGEANSWEDPMPTPYQADGPAADARDDRPPFASHLWQSKIHRGEILAASRGGSKDQHEESLVLLAPEDELPELLDILSDIAEDIANVWPSDSA